MPVREALYNSAALTLLIVGVVLWVRALVRGDAQRWLESPPRLPAWSIPWGDFLLLPFIALILLIFLPAGLFWVSGIKTETPRGAITVLLSGYGMGLALIGAAALFRLLPCGHPGESRESALRCIGSGLLGLVYFVPPCALLAFGWTALIKALGWPAEVQEVVLLIRDTTEPAMLVHWIIVVAVLAPIGEELVFRAGLFRFLSNRMNPALAASISAVLFAALHWNLQASLPLFALGLVLAAVYYKTGRILAAIVLHAAFNLNTLLAIFSGAGI